MANAFKALGLVLLGVVVGLSYDKLWSELPPEKSASTTATPIQNERLSLPLQAETTSPRRLRALPLKEALQSTSDANERLKLVVTTALLNPDELANYADLRKDFPSLASQLQQLVFFVAQFDPDGAKRLASAHLDPGYQKMLEQSMRHLRMARPEDAEQALAAARAATDPSQQVRLYQTAISQYAAEDPQRALAILDEVPNGQKRNLAASLAHGWAQSDPVGAANWLLQIDLPPITRSSALSSIAGSWAQQDFASAEAFASSLSGREQMAFTAALIGMAPATEIDSIRRLLSTQSGSPQYPQLALAAVSRLSREAPDTAFELTKELTGLAKQQALQMVVAQRAVGDASGTRVWVESLVGEERDAASLGLASTLARSSPKAAMEVASSISNAGLKDQALMGIAGQAAMVDFEVAFNAFEQISNEDMRRSSVFMLVMASPNEATTKRIADRVGLSAEQIEQLGNHVLQSAVGGTTVHNIGFGFPTSTSTVVHPGVRIAESERPSEDQPDAD